MINSNVRKVQVQKLFALGFYSNSVENEFCILTPVDDCGVSTVFTRKQDAIKWSKKYNNHYEVIEVELLIPYKETEVEQKQKMTLAEIEKELGKKIELV